MKATGRVPARAAFPAMTDSTPKDYEIIATKAMRFMSDLPARTLAHHLRLLGGDHSGFAVNRLTHCLQTATRAHRANKDDEYMLCARV